MKKPVMISLFAAMLFGGSSFFAACTKGKATGSEPVTIQPVKQKGGPHCLPMVWPEPVKGYINTFYAPMGGC